MAREIKIDPITRIEGHLKVEVTVEDGQVVEAKSLGTLFRGIELILQGRAPRDAQHITQRVCGVCPASHALAAAKNLEAAFGVTPPDNAHLIRNLVVGANFLMSHITHFYHLAGLDYVLGPKAPPFVPRYEGDYRLPPEANDAVVSHYLQALEMRLKAHEMLAVFGGKMPHLMTFLPGGVTVHPTADKIAEFSSILKDLTEFITQTYVPDVLAVADAYSDYFSIGVGCRNFLAYGSFDLEATGADHDQWIPGGTYTDGALDGFTPDRITENVKYSWYAERTTGLNPAQGQTQPEPSGILKPRAYSWIKAPRYGGKVHEVGPLARLTLGYLQGQNARLRELVDSVLARYSIPLEGLFSVMGRHATRALECQLIAEAMAEWLDQLLPGAPVYQEYHLPKAGEGAGLVEAPRGALGHWIRIEDGKIANYQIVTPTAWNASPRDDEGKMGPLEQALLGTPVADEENPIEVLRVIRSFDPCTACAVHLIEGDREVGTFQVL